MARDTGIPPWEVGNDLPRRRFGQVAAILSTALQLADLYKPHGDCPLMQALGGR